MKNWMNIHLQASNQMQMFILVNCYASKTKCKIFVLLLVNRSKEHLANHSFVQLVQWIHKVAKAIV